ncbi:hypothetical protein HMF7854_12850 [Sphingomonas ginkgonis]|uniref:Uncharacterized protein n=1 Tax=Sphingomonas ginkgonis TaxID=2315330 RepID=A0A3S0ENJ1_9SPHN|nr:hypothetical protein [Sphingomonas ginkgonis]RST31621.1 hypothetical protein HMF7854_12850 [Sphingomonas ginkgonis]
MIAIDSILTLGAVGLTGLGITSAALLKGWQGWLDVRRLEIARIQDGGAPVATGGRIEIADLRERVRKLEAIAAGIDL